MASPDPLAPRSRVPLELFVTTEQRLYRTPDGVIRASLLHGFWGRYRHAFSGVRVVARVFEAGPAAQRFGPVEQDGVTVVALPPFDGLLSFAAAYRDFRRRTASLGSSDAAVLLRMPSFYAARIARRLVRAGKPFGAEIVADPAQVLSRGSVRHPARILLRSLASAEQRWLCRHASATAYVTAATLQQRYPPHASRFTTHCSDIELDDADFIATPGARQRGGVMSLVHVGTFSQPYKGQDLLLQAVRALRARRLDVRATLIGDGKYRARLETWARERGLAPFVEFTGEIGERVELRRRLDAADLFVFPSRAEGLPRALIEAMARGLPCVATSVGGIPELLPQDALCPPGDATSLAARIAEVLADGERMRRMSAANLTRAREYHCTALRQRGESFQERLRDQTLAWLRERSRG